MLVHRIVFLAGFWVLVTATGLARAQVDDNLDISRLGFMTGHWQAADDGLAEEIWMSPLGGVMPGSFRWVMPKNFVVLEYLVVEETDDGVVFRFKHFGTDFQPWKKAAPNTYRLVSVEEKRAVFEIVNWNGRVPKRMNYERIDDTKLLFTGDNPDSDDEPLVLMFELVQP